MANVNETASAFDDDIAAGTQFIFHVLEKTDPRVLAIAAIPASPTRAERVFFEIHYPVQRPDGRHIGARVSKLKHFSDTTVVAYVTGDAAAVLSRLKKPYDQEKTNEDLD